MEISAYQKLLECEEARMGLSPSPDSERPRKRKRIDIDESYTGKLNMLKIEKAILHNLLFIFQLKRQFVFPIL